MRASSASTGESRILRFVVKLLRIDRAGWIALLPDDGSTNGFIQIDELFVVQLRSNAIRADDDMLRRIPRLQQMVGRSFPRQHNKRPRPPCLCRDSFLPFQFRQCWLFTDVLRPGRPL